MGGRKDFIFFYTIMNMYYFKNNNLKKIKWANIEEKIVFILNVFILKILLKCSNLKSFLYLEHVYEGGM